MNGNKLKKVKKLSQDFDAGNEDKIMFDDQSIS